MTDDPVAETTASYDEIASAYAARTATPVPALRGWLNRFAAELRPAARVADLGCGPARDGAELTARGLCVVGVDRSAGMLAVASGRLAGRVVQGDLRRLPLAAGALAGAWSAAALLHVPRTDVPAALSELRRVLRPGGVLGLITAMGESEGYEEVDYAAGRQRWFVYHDAGALRQLLAGAGFELMDAAENRANRHWLQLLARAQ